MKDMNRISSPEIGKIWNKLVHGERLDKEDGLAVLESSDLLGIGYIADRLRHERIGRTVTFVGNYHVCYTNICRHHCRYCIFRKDPEDPQAFTLNLEQIKESARDCKKDKYPEILLMGGINPQLTFEFILQMLKIIKEEIPGIHILGFSPVEIDFYASRQNTSPAEVLKQLKMQGLTAITGGGAEIFSPRMRKHLGCEEKINSDQWLEIMEAAHRQGIRSNACILYGAGETLVERMDHLDKIRSVQDKTNGFTHILPFAFSGDDKTITSGYDDLKMIALCRIYLDNINHVRAYWSHLGLKGAQIALSFGADDLNGLKQKGRIIHSSGGHSGSQTNPEKMIALIKDAGRIPAQRDILFNILHVYN